jgi:hypothetical protein
MKITAENYAAMREWFAVVFEVENDDPDLPPEIHPVAVLDDMAKRSPANARKGLGMAIADTIEMTDAWDAKVLLQLDRQLTGLGLPTLSEMRLRFGKRLSKILRRGTIRSEEEYYLLRNAAELPDQPTDEIWRLLSEYEARL